MGVHTKNISSEHNKKACLLWGLSDTKQMAKIGSGVCGSIRSMTGHGPWGLQSWLRLSLLSSKILRFCDQPKLHNKHTAFM